jgi:uncharacterized membrane protein YdjX (TVP38/TMEM64 family)
VSRATWGKAAVATAFLVAGAATWLLMHGDNAVAHWFESIDLSENVRAMGAWGPMVVIALMSLAILVSPLPSAPIALAAGAAYGHTWGTLYVAIGSELGAIAAFMLARYLGREFVHRHFGARLSTGLAGSQRVLMTTVFVSRLLPFVSFDVVSYAAGLTVLSLPRFALATFAGILPASFLLAHFGSTLSTDTALSGWITVAVLGVLGVAPLLVHLLHKQ